MQLKQEFHRNAEKLQEIWECGLRDAAVAAWRCHLKKWVHFLRAWLDSAPWPGDAKRGILGVDGSVLHEESQV